MTAIVLVLTALAVALTLGLLAREDPGYVLISRWPYEIEVSLALFLAGLTVGLVAVYFLIRVLFRIFHAPRDLHHWQARRRHARADRATLTGYARLIEGEWEEAEIALNEGLGRGSTPLLQYLGAAYAAQQRGDFEARDRYLVTAREEDPDHLEAIEITRARLLERAGQIDEARGVLEQLHEQGVRHRAVQRMLLGLIRTQHDWPALELLLKRDRDLRALPRAELDMLRQEMQVQRLAKPDDSGSAWTKLTRRQRKDPVLQAARARALINSGEGDAAEQFLRKCIVRQWDSGLVRLYGHAHSQQIEEQLRRVEQWEQGHKEDPDLLMTLARLHLANRDRDKARDHLLKAVRLDGSREEYLELGLLLESMGESDKALQCYRRGLQSAESKDAPQLLRESATAEGELIPLPSTEQRP